MKTKITTALLAIAILFSFAACGKSADDTTTSAPTTVQTTIQETGATAAETTAETGAETNTDSRTGAATTAAATNATTQAAATTVPAANTFTKTELAKFDGKNGNKGYFAYKGIVYDVTNKPESKWVNGTHNGLVLGKDLTAAFDNCGKHLKPFIEEQFSKYTKVGTYIG